MGHNIYRNRRDLGQIISTDKLLSTDYRRYVPVTEEPILIFQTNKSGTFNPVFEISSGVLDWDLGNGVKVSTNTPSIVYPDSTVKTIKVYKGSVSVDTAIITLISFNVQGVTGQLNMEKLPVINGNNIFNGSSITGLKFSNKPNQSANWQAQNDDIKTGLDLSSFTLSGSLNIYNQPNLETITFSSNNGTFTSTAVRLTKVQSLDISTFELSGTIFIFSNSLLSLITWGTVVGQFTQVLLNGNALNQSTVDNIFSLLNTWYSSHPPTANLTVNTSGGTNASPTGGINNTDILALGDIFDLAGKFLNITIN